MVRTTAFFSKVNRLYYDGDKIRILFHLAFEFNSEIFL